MRDDEAAADGPTDPRVSPERSPGFGDDGPADVEVSREDVAIGEASPRELAATDVTPIADDDARDHVERLECGDAVERQRAALALAEADPEPAVVEALAAAGLRDDDADVRQFAVEALAKVGGERAERAARAVADDRDPWVRAEAVVALDRLDREAHADRIEAALADDHHAVRRNALVSVFKRRGEDALGPLLDAVDDESERVREWAAHLLAGVDDDRARAALRAVAADESERRIVRETAARALDADPRRFRRQFTGAADGGDAAGARADRLNRRPDL
ncbi:HEAT repeat domain-containing protein [Halomicrobium salinisoli]|uniref:HEAT repeat domain-containing protein n=1 Tax=Halomicrobium salinisoli TaxID=2878391 RepID=UPI001CEFB54A|nr:HEAT repeat domain-containing protein [Halomicrobium salinisoli]